jgi:hypothetical protein
MKCRLTLDPDELDGVIIKRLRDMIDSCQFYKGGDLAFGDEDEIIAASRTIIRYLSPVRRCAKSS